MKGGVIHDHNTALWQLGDEVLDHPRVKDLGIDGGRKQTHREKGASQKSPNHVGATFCTPILSAVTSFAPLSVSMGAGHIMGKTALVKGYDGPSCLFIGPYLLAEDRSFFGIRLGTPRPEAQRQRDGRVITRQGDDVTQAFVEGGHKALALANSMDARLAILKARSPSCGNGDIYDGTFTKRRIPGMGVTAELLSNHGVLVFNEEEIEDARCAYGTLTHALRK